MRAGYSVFLGLPKKKLIAVIMRLRDEYTTAQAQIDQLKGDLIELTGENAKLKEELNQQQIKAVNQAANKPSSKQAEWEAKGNQTDQHQEGENKKKKKRRRKPRAGAGNQAKHRKADRTKTATVDQCDQCGKDLRDKPALKSTNERIIEDIPDPAEETVVVKIIQEKKYCDDCQRLVGFRRDHALAVVTVFFLLNDFDNDRFLCRIGDVFYEALIGAGEGGFIAQIFAAPSARIHRCCLGSIRFPILRLIAGTGSGFSPALFLLFVFLFALLGFIRLVSFLFPFRLLR